MPQALGPWRMSGRGPRQGPPAAAADLPQDSLGLGVGMGYKFGNLENANRIYLEGDTRGSRDGEFYRSRVDFEPKSECALSDLEKGI